MKRTVLRRVVALALMACVAVALAGCGPLVEDDETQSLSVYASFYPIYALTDAVLRDVPDASLHCLIQPQDGCLRDYQLSDWDAALLSYGADAVVMGGRGLESFESTLFGWGEQGPAVSAVLYNLELYNQGDGNADPEAESHLKGSNPHLYMSITGAGRMIESICAMLQSMDPRYNDLYVANMQAATERLDGLLAECRDRLAGLSGRRVILMNEALIYLANDYGLEVAEWIDRESGEAMSDNEFAMALERLTASEATVVLIEAQAPQSLTQSLESAGFSVARIDVLSTHREGEGFETYLEAQKNNAQAVLDAFARSDSASKEGH